MKNEPNKTSNNPVKYKNQPYTVSEFIDIAAEQDYNFNENMEYCDKELYPGKPQGNVFKSQIMVVAAHRI